MTAQPLAEAVRLHQAGDLEGAGRAYRRILEVDPRNAHALHYLGLIDLQSDRPEEALARFAQALGLLPREAAFHCNMGQAYRKTERLDDAEKHYRVACRLAPGMFEAWHNLALLLAAGERDVEAVDCFGTARKLCAGAYPGDPDYAAALVRVGRLLLDRGAAAAARKPLLTATAIDAQSADAWTLKGSADAIAGFPIKAIEAFDTAIALKADDARLFNNRGNAHRDAGHLQLAMADYRQALTLDPEFLDARSNLLFTALSAIVDPAELDGLTREHGAAFPSADRQEPRNMLSRPRIGLVSGDLRNHPVARFLLGWLEHRPRDCPLYAYHDHPLEDPVSERIQETVDQWCNCASMDDDALRARIAEDGIDLLIDLSGHTANNRLALFARRAAPLQATFLGYAGSTGLDCFDARFADPVTEPVDADGGSEHIVRVEGSYFNYTLPDDAPSAASDGKARRKYLTIGCSTQLAKLTDSTISLWAKVLGEIPRYRLEIRSTVLDDPAMREELLARLAAAGIHVKHVKLHGPLALDKYLKWWRGIDLALDTTPFNLAAQSCDALAMGVPLVTLRGDRHAGRIGASILESCGLPELVASTPEQFRAIAGDLLSHSDRLGQMRRRVREVATERRGIFEAAEFAERLERAIHAVLEDRRDQ